MKPKKLILMCLLLQALFGGTRAVAQTLVLHHADGTTTDVELFTQPQVKFQDDKVLVTSTVLDMEYAKEDVLRFTYRGTPVSISQAKGKADYTREYGQLVFHGIKKTDAVAVYKPNGIRVPVRLTCTGSDAVLSLSQIPSGVYLLSVNGRTSKFTKP